MEIINILAILLSPIIALVIGLYLQNKHEKADRKYKLFATIMAHRKLRPVTYPFADALNQIDIVYYKSPKVLEIWHEYHPMITLLSDGKLRANQDEIDRKFVDLLHAMALDLGYRKLSRNSIEEFYLPVSHSLFVDKNEMIQNELLRVLCNTQNFLLVGRENKNHQENNNDDRNK